ncbi:MAG TPA: 3-hydroxyacyl-ACP dehydratase FabZ family protein [Tepidisphaeraceae bacterium]|jgi:3-hydroxyacyl-[acyl-carrier-protein] dehydratase|nr:3-hydroxyacyl-ACP dehydratase FabZ family protein [Tepidisphaeraceae bacterium]
MASDGPDQKTIDHIKTILRRDLKLGPDAQIADDMPFFNSDVDLDSLDMLLLVTSIEKEFGIKIPNEAVGKQVFENITTLASYIHEQMKAQGETSSSTAGGAQTPDDLLARLPHRDPFRFVSKIVEIKPGETAEAVWTLTGNEVFFAGHFPGRPLVPGVLIAEALAQLSGLIAPDREAMEGKLAHVDVRFEQAVCPPAEIVLHSRLARAMGPLQHFEVHATLGDQTIAKGSLTLHKRAVAVPDSPK